MLGPRGSSTYLGYGALVLIIMYLIFLYQSTVNNLGAAEKNNDKLTQRNAELHSELQVGQEYKIRLKTTLDQTKDDLHRCTAGRHELEDTQKENLRKNTELNTRYNEKEAELSELQRNHGSLRDRCQVQQEDYDRQLESARESYESLSKSKLAMESSLKETIGMKDSELAGLRMELETLKSQSVKRGLDNNELVVDQRLVQPKQNAMYQQHNADERQQQEPQQEPQQRDIQQQHAQLQGNLQQQPVQPLQQKQQFVDSFANVQGDVDRNIDRAQRNRVADRRVTVAMQEQGDHVVTGIHRGEDELLPRGPAVDKERERRSLRNIINQKADDNYQKENSAEMADGALQADNHFLKVSTMADVVRGILEREPESAEVLQHPTKAQQLPVEPDSAQILHQQDNIQQLPNKPLALTGNNDLEEKKSFGAFNRNEKKQGMSEQNTTSVSSLASQLPDSKSSLNESVTLNTTGISDNANVVVAPIMPVKLRNSREINVKNTASKQLKADNSRSVPKALEDDFRIASDKDAKLDTADHLKEIQDEEHYNDEHENPDNDEDIP